MTITETRPGAVSAASIAQPQAARETVFSTGDHKQLGRLLLVVGLLSVAVGCVLAALYQSPVGAERATAWTDGGSSRISSAAVTATFVIGLPAVWLGLLAVVVPLQLGATRASLPRLQATAVWGFITGALVVAAAYVFDRPIGPHLGSSLPLVTGEGERANDVTLLLLAGLMLITISTALAAVSLLVTVLTQRAEGMTLLRMPVLSWTALAGSTVLLLSAGAFFSGLFLTYLDRRYGGELFGQRGGFRVWQHQMWQLGRPEAFLYAALGIGAFCDVVATHSRRPLVAFPVARGLAIATVFATLLAWAANTSALSSPVAPLGTPAQGLIAIPAGLTVLVWLASLRRGVKLHPSLLFAAGFILLLALPGLVAGAAALVGVEGEGAESMRNGQITVLMLGAPLLAAAGALAHWTPKVWGGRTSPVSLLQLLLLLGGIVLLAAPAYAIGFGMDDDIAIAGSLGALLVAAGVAASLLPALGARKAGAGRSDDDDQGEYRGLTLEWATPTPPPAHNFDVIPPIRSAHPLHDERNTQGVPA